MLGAMKTHFHSRRDFLKTTTLAAVSVPFMGAFASSLRAAEPQRKLGFALVGLGSLSTHQLASALQKTKFCQLAGIVTGTPDKVKMVGAIQPSRQEYLQLRHDGADGGQSGH